MRVIIKRIVDTESEQEDNLIRLNVSEVQLQETEFKGVLKLKRKELSRLEIKFLKKLVPELGEMDIYGVVTDEDEVQVTYHHSDVEVYIEGARNWVMERD